MKRHVVQKKKKNTLGEVPDPGRGREQGLLGHAAAARGAPGKLGEARRRAGDKVCLRSVLWGPPSPLSSLQGSRWVPYTAPRPHLSAAGSHQHESPMPGPQSLAQRRPKVQPLRGFPRHPPPRASAPRWGRTWSLAAEFGMLGGCTARSVGCHLCPRPVSVNIQPRGKIRQGREPTSWAMLPQTEAPVTP